MDNLFYAVQAQRNPSKNLLVIARLRYLREYLTLLEGPLARARASLPAFFAKDYQRRGSRCLQMDIYHVCRSERITRDPEKGPQRLFRWRYRYKRITLALRAEGLWWKHAWSAA
jgi:hypothetical protein